MANGCSDNTPPVDERCDDPAFRAANPEICRLHPELILTPSYSLTEPGKTITYAVLLRANGIETPITKGLTWFTSNVGVATINNEGVATGVLAGQVTISVTWQDLSAQAQLDVVGSCAETHQNFRILIDHSKSMGQSFSSGYATKLAFSKATAADFIDTINYSKDQVAVSMFSDAYGELQPWTDDALTARAAVNSIALAQEKTDIADALSAAIESFNGQLGVRVVVMFTDGEWTGSDPKAIAQAFKESGGFLVIVATRSWGEFFVDMLEMASDGFLLSAYGATQSGILASLSGLKSFICSGSCTPDPGTAPMAQLNYTGFINWDVTAGRVDLIGLGLWDVRPGNGLYVDLQGTGDAGFPAPGQDFGLGQLTSKADFTFTAGQTYRFTISVGGSQAANNGGLWEVRLRVGDEFDNTVQVLDGVEPLTPRVFEWTPSTNHTGKIIIEQSSIPAGAHHNVGCTIDEITLENITTPETLIYDNFDSENPVTIPPNLNSNFGCLVTPPGSQAADPTPPVRLAE